MYRNKIFGGLWNMKNIFKMNITIRGMKSSMTNVTNMHTCTTRTVHLITTVILVLESQLLEFSNNVIFGSSVGVPVGVDGV